MKIISILFWIITVLAMSVGVVSAETTSRKNKPIRVVVWDERQLAQKQVYPNFLGNYIADYLISQGRGKREEGREIVVKSVGLDDPDQGLPKETLDNCDVLIWWGHQRHAEVKEELVKDIVQRIKTGRLSLLALHSAHWSKPFIAVMNERSIEDALKSLTPAERKTVKIVTIAPEMRLATRTELRTPSFSRSVGANGKVTLEVKLPSCVFPAVRADAKPSHVHVLLTKHPIAKGVPENFDISQTEMYEDPFHVPTPDVTLFDERWDSGEHFHSGCVWKVGAGLVFYFRPGHETYPVFKEPAPMKIVENAVRFLGAHTRMH